MPPKNIRFSAEQQSQKVESVEPTKNQRFPAEQRVHTSTRSSANFDKTTGAIDREVKVFGGKKCRGYGKVASYDDHPLLKGQLTIISGPTGSGKTVLALNLLEEICDSCAGSKLGTLYLYTGSPQDKALHELDPDLVQIYGPEQEQKLVDDLRKLQSDMRMVPDESKPLNILVLDDTGASKLLAPNQVKGSVIGEIFVSHRHLSLHVIVLAQRIRGMVSPFLLANMSQLFLFAGKNKADQDDLLANIPLSKDNIEKQLAIIAADPHKFLWVNIPKRTAMVGFSECVLS